MTPKTIFIAFIFPQQPPTVAHSRRRGLRLGTALQRSQFTNSWIAARSLRRWAQPTLPTYFIVRPRTAVMSWFINQLFWFCINRFLTCSFAEELTRIATHRARATRHVLCTLGRRFVVVKIAHKPFENALGLFTNAKSVVSAVCPIHATNVSGKVAQRF